MSSKTIAASVSISRSSDGFIRIRIRDREACAEFLEAKMTPEAFAEAITGLSDRDAIAEARGLERVGKRRIREGRQIECPLNSHDKKEISDWLAQNAQEEGWTLDTYLGSQHSVVRHDGKTRLSYAVFKYVEYDAAKEQDHDE